MSGYRAFYIPIVLICVIHACSDPVKILPLGDSITDGDSLHQSYRRQLWLKLDSAGFNMDFIGSKNLNGYHDHPPLFDDYTPDIVLLHIGTNDVFKCHETDTILSNIKRIIETLRNDNPSVKILLAQIIPLAAADLLGFDDTYCDSTKSLNTRIIELNELLPELVKDSYMETSPIILVDHYSRIDPASHLFDGIHPDEAGEKIMAAAWFSALEEFVN